ncbi:MAG TPA: hypothetical protein VMG58_03140, partial [Candidatus Sulfotelmatobacter sp.]|nr:hypothetical protein [Candidatus Sulfotelmatobacter sp.]
MALSSAWRRDERRRGAATGMSGGGERNEGWSEAKTSAALSEVSSSFPGGSSIGAGRTFSVCRWKSCGQVRGLRRDNRVENSPASSVSETSPRLWIPAELAKKISAERPWFPASADKGLARPVLQTQQ